MRAFCDEAEPSLSFPKLLRGHPSGCLVPHLPPEHLHVEALDQTPLALGASRPLKITSTLLQLVDTVVSTLFISLPPVGHALGRLSFHHCGI